MESFESIWSIGSWFPLARTSLLGLKLCRYMYCCHSTFVQIYLIRLDARNSNIMPTALPCDKNYRIMNLERRWDV